jgi:hypothetical protein
MVGSKFRGIATHCCRSWERIFPEGGGAGAHNGESGGTEPSFERISILEEQVTEMG